jgi:hypothetical protein
MNQITRPIMVLPADRNCALAEDATNASEFEGDIEKYEHLEALTELFFAAKRHDPHLPTSARP